MENDALIRSVTSGSRKPWQKPWCGSLATERTHAGRGTVVEHKPDWTYCVSDINYAYSNQSGNCTGGGS